MPVIALFAAYLGFSFLAAPWSPSLVEDMLEDCDRIPQLQSPAERREAPAALGGNRVALSSNLSWVLPAEWSQEGGRVNGPDGRIESIHWRLTAPPSQLQLRMQIVQHGSASRSEPTLRQWLTDYVPDVDAWLAAFKTDLAFFDHVQSITPATVRTAPPESRGLLLRLMVSERRHSMVRTDRVAGPGWVFYAEERVVVTEDGEIFAQVLFEGFNEAGALAVTGGFTSPNKRDLPLLWTALEQLAASASSKLPPE